MTLLRLNPDAVSWREIDGEVLALGHASSTYFSTSGSGALLWMSLADGASREQLIELIAGSFDVDRERAATDIDAFLAVLADKGLLAA
jgi:hypothetical protein